MGATWEQGQVYSSFVPPVSGYNITRYRIQACSNATEHTKYYFDFNDHFERLSVPEALHKRHLIFTTTL